MARPSSFSTFLSSSAKAVSEAVRSLEFWVLLFLGSAFICAGWVFLRFAMPYDFLGAAFSGRCGTLQNLDIIALYHAMLFGCVCAGGAAGETVSFFSAARRRRGAEADRRGSLLAASWFAGFLFFLALIVWLLLRRC